MEILLISEYFLLVALVIFLISSMRVISYKSVAMGLIGTSSNYRICNGFKEAGLDVGNNKSFHGLFDSINLNHTIRTCNLDCKHRYPNF